MVILRKIRNFFRSLIICGADRTNTEQEIEEDIELVGERFYEPDEYVEFIDESGRTLLEILKLQNANFGNGHAGKIDEERRQVVIEQDKKLKRQLLNIIDLVNSFPPAVDDVDEDQQYPDGNVDLEVENYYHDTDNYQGHGDDFQANNIYGIGYGHNNPGAYDDVHEQDQQAYEGNPLVYDVYGDNLCYGDIPLVSDISYAHDEEDVYDEIKYENGPQDDPDGYKEDNLQIHEEDLYVYEGGDELVYESEYVDQPQDNGYESETFFITASMVILTKVIPLSATETTTNTPLVTLMKNRKILKMKKKLIKKKKMKDQFSLLFLLIYISQ